jgi:hypothetical protein
VTGPSALAASRFTRRPAAKAGEPAMNARTSPRPHIRDLVGSKGKSRTSLSPKQRCRRPVIVRRRARPARRKRCSWRRCRRE